MIIHKIPAKIDLRKKRVAAYARVSTNTDEQAESFETQVDYYTWFIKQDENWEFAGVYADQGKTGTNAKLRPEFQRMMADARNRKFDILLVKAISRFARNVVDAQEYVHELKKYDVEVRFESERISSADPASELMFNMLAATAQEESRNKSEHIKWSYRKLAEKGIRHLGNNRVLGYDEVNGKLTPNGDAWIIARAFDLFIAGMQTGQIAKTLMSEGAHAIRGNEALTGQAIYVILRNEVYVGDRTLQKQAPQNYLTKRATRSPLATFKSYHLTDDHEPIITRDVWNAAQRLIQKTKDEREQGVFHTAANQNSLYGRIICAECGAPYTRRTLTARDGTHYKAWNCRERQKGRKGNGCKNVVVKEDDLLQRIAHGLGMKEFDESAFAATFAASDIKVLVGAAGIEVKEIA